MSGTLALSRDTFELPPTHQGIVDAIAGILTYANIQRIVVDASANSIVVQWYRHPSDRLELSPPEVNIEDTLSSVELTEVSMSGSNLERIKRGEHWLLSRAIQPLLLVCDNVMSLGERAGIELGQPLAQDLAGRSCLGALTLFESSMLDDTSVIIAGAKARTRDLRRITHGVRVVLEH
jgi:hypothetical protein